MLRIQSNRPTGIPASTMKLWGLAALLLGSASVALLQNGLLHLGEISAEELSQSMQNSNTVMMTATLALVLQAIGTCAVPIFALLLVEAYRREENFRLLAERVCVIALLSEIPFNLAMDGHLMAVETRNPAFGLVLGLVCLYTYGKLPEKKFAHIAVKVLVTVAALGWSIVLQIQDGFAVVALVAALWSFREKKNQRVLAALGCCAVLILLSPFYLAALLGVLGIYFYNGEAGEDHQAMTDLCYPGMLALMGVLGRLL